MPRTKYPICKVERKIDSNDTTRGGGRRRQIEIKLCVFVPHNLHDFDSNSVRSASGRKGKLRKIELFRRSNRFIFIDAREFDVKISALTRKIDNFGSSRTEQQQRKSRNWTNRKIRERCQRHVILTPILGNDTSESVKYGSWKFFLTFHIVKFLT